MFVLVTNPGGSLKPDKAKSAEKIDGIVALMMAIDRASRDTGEETVSVYEERSFSASISNIAASA